MLFIRQKRSRAGYYSSRPRSSSSSTNRTSVDSNGSHRRHQPQRHPSTSPPALPPAAPIHCNPTSSPPVREGRHSSSQLVDSTSSPARVRSGSFVGSPQHSAATRPSSSGSRLRRFNITFSVPVFHAGQTVGGQVFIELTEPMKIRGVRLKLAGKSFVYWSEKHTTGAGRSRTTVTRTFTNHETYFDHRLTLWGKPEGDRSGDNPVLQPGTHIYPFQFQLPHNLPSSYEGLHGGVRYFCKANIDKPWKFDHVTKQAFTVISILDLNMTPQAMSAAINENDKTICCLCCASGPISCTAQISRIGYVPGECIALEGQIENKSKRELRGSAAILREKVYFHGTSKTKVVSRDVVVIERGPIPAGTSDNWDSVALRIPPLAPSELIGCAIIDIEYSLDLVVDVSSMAFDLVVSLPVIIGTIPMQTLFRSVSTVAGLSSPPPPYSSGVTSPVTSPIPPPYQDLYPDLPPPSYQYTVFGETTDLREDPESSDSDTDTVVMGSAVYCPMYTYYDT